MSYTSDSADQIVRYSLEGTEVALKLSGLAAKNFAIFAYAVLQDHEKTSGKTKLTKLLKRQKPLKFFTMPEDRMPEFTKEARRHGLLFVPMRDKTRPRTVEITVLAQDAAKVNRIMDRMCLDFVKAGVGDAVPEQPTEKEASAPIETPVQTETVETEQGTVEFVVGDFEDAFGIDKGDDANFTQGPAGEPSVDQPEKSIPSEPSSPSKSSSPMPSAGDKAEEPVQFEPHTTSSGSTPTRIPEYTYVPDAAPEANRHSVLDELRAIQRGLKERAERIKQQRTKPAPQRARSRKKKAKGR